MKNIFKTLLTGLLIAASVACSSEAPNAPASAGQDEADISDNRIAIPATVRGNLGITFSPVERRKVASTIRVPGSFELQPLARHEYRMVLPGHVQLRVNQYQRVEVGDVLYRFRSPQWPELQHEIIEGEQGIASAKASIAVAEAALTEAQERLALMKKRLSVLAQAEIRKAGLELEAATIEAGMPRLRAEKLQAETMLENAKRTHTHALHRASAVTGLPEARLSATVAHEGSQAPAYQTSDWIEVRSTQAGIVEMLNVTDGAYADASSLVLSTVEPSKVRFRAMALQGDLARFQNVESVRVVPPPTSNGDSNPGVAAEMTISLEAHPEQRTITLLATPSEQRDWVRPGVSAFLEVEVESSGGPALAIPRTAIVRDGIVHVFFLRDRNDPNKAIRVEADMGVSDGRWVQINSGLSKDDQVVLNGAYELKLASQQSGVSQKGGHFHADGTYHAEDE